MAPEATTDPLRRLVKREHGVSARREGAHEGTRWFPREGKRSAAALQQIDVDFAFLEPTAAISLPAKPPEREADHCHSDEQDHEVGPGDREPQDRGGRVAGPADESVFLDEAPQIDGNSVHAPSRSSSNSIGRELGAVDPSHGVPH